MEKTITFYGLTSSDATCTSVCFPVLFCKMAVKAFYKVINCIMGQILSNKEHIALK